MQSFHSCLRRTAIFSRLVKLSSRYDSSRPSDTHQQSYRGEVDLDAKGEVGRSLLLSLFRYRFSVGN
jgi:hypothetical protein